MCISAKDWTLAFWRSWRMRQTTKITLKLCMCVMLLWQVHEQACVCVYVCVRVFHFLCAGYEQFGLMRSDPALCFRALCGEEPCGSKKKKRRLAKKALQAAKRAAKAAKDMDGGGEESDISGMSDSGEENETEDGRMTTPTAVSSSKRYG